MTFLTENAGRLTRHPPTSCSLLKPASCSDRSSPLLFQAEVMQEPSQVSVMKGDLPQAPVLSVNQ